MILQTPMCLARLYFKYISINTAIAAGWCDFRGPWLGPDVYKEREEFTKLGTLSMHGSLEIGLSKV